MHPRLRVTNLVTSYVSPEESCVVPNKSAYLYDDTWSKVVKVLDPGILKMKAINVSIFYFILYLSKYPSLFFQTIFRWFSTYQSGVHSLHVMASSLT